MYSNRLREMLSYGISIAIEKKPSEAACVLFFALSEQKTNRQYLKAMAKQPYAQSEDIQMFAWSDCPT